MVDERMRQVAELPSQEEAQATVASIDFESMEITDLFHKLEIDVTGYDEYENCNEAHYQRSIEGLQVLTKKIQRGDIFSANESIEEIQTDHLKMLMVPYLEAQVLYRVMTDRAQSVKKAHLYYLEYLKLMNHYNMLDKPLQVNAWKVMAKKQRERTNPGVLNDDDEEEESKSSKPQEHPMVALARSMEDRDAKIANFKLKKAIEANLARLRNYEDEEMKRDFYFNQLKLSIMNTFEQLRSSDMEMDMLTHAASLSADQIAQNNALSAPIPRDKMKPLQAQFIGPDDIKRMTEKVPYMVQPSSGQEAESNVVQEYIDPMRQYKPIERVQVRNEDINDRMTLKTQYQQQVFQPGHNLPTMSLEELADIEVADALERQEKEKEQEAARANEDPDDEEILERQRQKDSAHDDWKDYVPKGRGNTKRI